MAIVVSFRCSTMHYYKYTNLQLHQNMAFSEVFDSSICEWMAKNSTDTEEVLDYLLTAASNAYDLSSGTEATELEQQISSPSHTPINRPSSYSSLPARFARPVSNGEIIDARIAGIPQTTKNDA